MIVHVLVNQHMVVHDKLLLLMLLSTTFLQHLVAWYCYHGSSQISEKRWKVKPFLYSAPYFEPLHLLLLCTLLRMKCDLVVKPRLLCVLILTVWDYLCQLWMFFQHVLLLICIQTHSYLISIFLFLACQWTKK